MTGGSVTRSLRARADAVARMALRIPGIPTDGFLRLCQRLTSMAAKAVFAKDWQLEVRGRPQFFKHEVNLSRWPFEPGRWAFAARGVYSRAEMNPASVVLDACCGDGTYSRLFFSDIAKHVDAVDADAYAIDYARSLNAAENVSFHRLDLLTDELPRGDYDTIVWNSAICYFSLPEINALLRRFIACSKPSVVLSGCLPKANGWVDHKTEFSDLAAVERLLSGHFSHVAVWQIHEAKLDTFYFRASQPLSEPNSR